MDAAQLLSRARERLTPCRAYLSAVDRDMAQGMLIIAAKHGVLRRIPLHSVLVRQEKSKGEAMSRSTRSRPEAFRLALRLAVAAVLVALTGAEPAGAQITRCGVSRIL